MRATELAASIVALLCLTVVFVVLLAFSTGGPKDMWMCRALGKHKFRKRFGQPGFGSYSDIVSYCVRCGAPWRRQS